MMQALSYSSYEKGGRGRLEGSEEVMNDLSAKLHKTFAIDLESKGLSGYEWQPVFHTDALKLIGRRRKVNMKSFGASGTEIFKFEPLRTGDYTVTFELVRPFEKKSIDQKAFSVHIY